MFSWLDRIMITDKSLRKATKPFGAFKKNALGIDSSGEDEIQQHFLRGAWGEGTLKSYNSGIVKLHRFATLHNIEKAELLPITPRILKRFVVWASKKEVSDASEDESVKSTTLKAYIAGIKAWHLFHDTDYPRHADDAIRTLLKATRMIEAQHQEIEKKRPPVLLSDLVVLLEVLPSQGERGLAMLTAALVAFWGIARLGEILSDNPKKILPRWDNLVWNEDKTYVKINLYNAKTAGPGEIQCLHLQKQASLLDPVSMLEEWKALRPRKTSEELFSVMSNGKLRRLGKQEMIIHLRSIWNARRSKKKQLLHGHSFRIGGASLKWNLGASREDLKVSGRWASNAYLIYLRKFSERDLEKTKKLLQDLEWVPTRSKRKETKIVIDRDEREERTQDNDRQR